MVQSLVPTGAGARAGDSGQFFGLNSVTFAMHVAAKRSNEIGVFRKKGVGNVRAG
jgi:hypothetical protein